MTPRLRLFFVLRSSTATVETAVTPYRSRLSMLPVLRPLPETPGQVSGSSRPAVATNPGHSDTLCGQSTTSTADVLQPTYRTDTTS